MIVAIGVAAILLCGRNTAIGQQRRIVIPAFQRRVEVSDSYVMLPTPPREFQRSLTKARQALQEGRHADAIELLDRLLADPEIGDFFLADTDDQRADQSFRGEILKLLGEMPPAAQELYELQHGNDAKRLLAQALDRSDLEAVREVSRRFLGTAAGREATLVLARYHLDRREPTTALMHLRRLEALTAFRQSMEPDLSLLMAMAWQLMGAEDKALALLTALPAVAETTDVVVRGTNQRIPRDFAELNQLFRGTSDQADIAIARAANWTTAHGDTHRDRRCQGGMPLPHLEWYVSNSLLESESQMLTEAQRRFIHQEHAALPTTLPLVANGYVMMRTPKLSMGVQLPTGLRRWIYPFSTSIFSVPAVAPVESVDGTMAQGTSLLQERTWDDQVHSQVSCDDRRVYFVVDDGTRRVMDPNQVVMWQRGFGGDVEIPSIRNQLVALELATEGKILWIIGGEDGEEPLLADAFFLGPPLAVQGELYVIAEWKDEIRLVALDPQTGRLRWSQQLVHFESPFSVALDECRRMGGAVPTFADGILICPTAAEAVVALDPSSRSLIWGYKYSRSVREDEHMMGAGMIYSMTTMPPPGQRWADGFAMAVQGRVLVTPIESNQLYCIDQLTGKLNWQAPRGEGLFLGGVDQDVVAVVERRHVRSYHLDSGAEVWPRIELPAGGLPSGRGFVNGRFLFLPTTAMQMLKIDLSSGTIAETLNTDVVLGNLTCHGPYLISYGADAVRTYYLRDPMRHRLTEAIAKSPDDPQALEAYANLLVGDGRLAEAVEILKRCRDLRTDPAARRMTTDLLGQTVLMALRQDFPQFANLLPLAREIFHSDGEIRQLLRVEAEGRYTQGDRAAALSALLQLAQQLATGKEAAWDESLRHPKDDDARLSEPVWLAVAIRRLLTDDPSMPWTETTRDALVTQLAEGIDALTEIGSPRALKMAVTVAVTPELEASARAKLAMLAQSQGDALMAELQWSRLLSAPQAEERIQAAQELGSLLLALGDYRRAAEVYRKAIDRDRESGQPIEGLTQRLTEVERTARLPEKSWNRGQTVAREEPQRQDEFSLQRIMVINWRDGTGPTREGWTAIFDTNSREILVVDEYGQVRCRIPSASTDIPMSPAVGGGTLFAVSCADLMVLCLGTQITAIDLSTAATDSTPRILWQRDVTDLAAASVNGRRPVADYSMQHQMNPFAPTQPQSVMRRGMLLPAMGPLNQDTFCFVSGGVLECVDAMTGQSLWRRRGLDESVILFGDEDHLFVLPDDEETAQVFRIADGELIGNRRVPAVMNQWERRGRLVLAYEQKISFFGTRRIHLKLWDPWIEKAVWSMRFPEGTRGCLIGFDQMGILDPAGKLQIVDLFNGTPRAEAAVAISEPAAGLEIIRSHDRYLCFIFQTDTHYARSLVPHGVQLHGPLRGFRQQLFTGLLLALDRETGQPSWTQPAEIRQYTLPSLQPGELPLLPLYRGIHFQKERQGLQKSDGHEKMLHELLCLDLRTGGIAFHRAPAPAMGQMLMAKGDPAKDTVDILTDRRVALRVAIGEAPIADSAPANIPPLDLDKE